MPRRSSGGLEDGGASSSKDKRARVNWSVEENNLLINAWLNISKDSIHINDPKLESYWKRITSYYNENREEMPPRVPKQLKDHWLKMKQAVCKFDGCYNRILKRKQSWCSESQIITEAHTLYKSDDGKSFTMEYVWRLLKDEPRWRDVVEEYCSKRTKVSESGAYTSSSNMETPTSPDTSAPPLESPVDQKAYASSSNMETAASLDKSAPPLECPMGHKAYTSSSNMQTPVSPDKSTPPLECPVDQKAAKSRSKAVEEAELGSAISRFEEMHETTERKVAALEQLGLAKQEEARAKQEEARAKQEEARAKQEEARAKQEEARAMAEEARAKQQVLEYEILMKDTSQMTEAQQRDHNRICELIRQKLFGV